MVHCLCEGLQNDAVCDSIFDVLSDADLFLDTICYFDHGWMFYKIYNSAIAKAKEQCKFKAIHQLLIARAFGEITWDYGATLTLLKEAEEIEKQNPLLILKVAMGKRMCYYGIHLLASRATAKGSEILETGISLLSSENTVLKVLSSQILALITPHTEKSSYYRNIVLTESANRPSLYAFFKDIQEDDCADEKENENPKASSQPLILALLINDIAYDNECDMKYKLGLQISQLQKTVEAEAQNDRLYLPLLLIVENALRKIKYKIERENPAALLLAIDNFIKENGRQNPDTAVRYYCIGKALYRQDNYDAALRSHYEALEIRLKLYGHNHVDCAKSYYQIGLTQICKGDYNSALQSYEQALDISQNIQGKIHLDVSSACDMIGVTKYRLKEYDSAVRWHQQALDIKVALYGKEHPAVADSYFNISNCQCKMQDYDSALESCQQAHDIRLKLFGQESAVTSQSFCQLKMILRSRMKVCGSSLEVQ
jgi:tetratricopeptide (TPR) repeat protein